MNSLAHQKTHRTTKLAVDDGAQSVKALGPFTTKIHQEELLELLDLWEYAPGVKAKIEKLVIQHARRSRAPIFFATIIPVPAR